MSKEQEGIISIERALDQGQIFQAHNLASELLLEFPDNLRISQLNAISLNRLGQPEKALKRILADVKKGATDSETMGLLGRTNKDLYKNSGEIKYLKKSAEAYFSGYLFSKDYYPAINAAGLYCMLNKRDKAEELAERILLQLPSPNNYWETSTIAEAHLILGNYEESKNLFGQAIEEYPKQFGKFESTSAQLTFLSSVLEIPKELLEMFPKPNLAIFSGHMIDAPNRKDQRFPQQIEKNVKSALKKIIHSLDIDIGFVSLASGGDILFAELLQEKNAEIKAYMPFRKDDFINTSVASAGFGWIRRFEHCYDCSPKYLTTEPYLDTPDLFNHLGKVMMGECIILAEQYGTKPSFISVLAPNQIVKTGGTLDLNQLWPHPETHFNVDPTEFLRTKKSSTLETSPTPINMSSEPSITRKITNILFADIVGFSKIAEEDIPGTIIRFMETISDQISPFSNQLEVVNTWGDAIIMCHKDVEVMMEIASRIQGIFTEEKTSHIKTGFNIRIAMHTGPAFFAEDPLTKDPNIYGSSVNRTARMEPVTLPGSIYASDQFAATLKLKTLDQFKYQHVGVIELPKGFGKQEVYQISENV